MSAPILTKNVTMLHIYIIAMDALFDSCIGVLHRAFDSDTWVSEEQYHRIVACLRQLAMFPPCESHVKTKILRKYNWPDAYDPCAFDPCIIRFFLHFGAGDKKLDLLLDDFSCLLDDLRSEER